MDIDQKINELEKIKKPWNISKDSINYICSILSKLNKPRVLEIGTYNGYSALHLAKCAKEVVTIDMDKSAYQLAITNTNMFKNILCLEGNALNLISKLGKFDLILIDGNKSEYEEYLLSSLKALKSKGYIFVDNTISHRAELTSFFELLEKLHVYHKETNLGKGLMVIRKPI